LKKTVGIATVVLVCLAGSAGAAPIDITGYTLTGSTNGSGDYDSNDATVASITTSGGTVSSFVGPTSANTLTAPGVTFIGTSETPPIPSNDEATQELSLLGNVPTRAWGGAGSMGIDLLFAQPIFDNDAGADSLYELFALELGGGDDITLQAIIGGTIGSPVLGGSPVTVASSDPAGQPELDITVSNGLGANSFDLGGSAFDLSEDLGVNSLIGVRYSTTAGADFSVLLANSASVIPEPSTCLLLVVGCSILAHARRRS